MPSSFDGTGAPFAVIFCFDVSSNSIGPIRYCVASGLHGLHAFERSKVLKPAQHMRACNQTHGVLAFLRDMHTSIAYILQ